MADSPISAPPASIEGFRLGGPIRESGVLSVYEGMSKLDLPVEVLLVRADALTGGFDADDVLAAVRRASSVQHEALLPFLTGGRHDGLLFAVAKRTDGDSLGDLVAKRGPLGEASAVDLVRATLGALAALERAGVRHGDLAPQRVHRVSDGRWLLGCPRVLPAALSPRPDRWQAPEEARGGENGVQSDLFVCGLLAAWALTGSHLAGEGADTRRILRDWRAPDLTGLRVAAPVRALLARLLAPEPSNRFATAADALQALEDAAAPRPETAPIALTPPPVLRPMAEPPKRAAGRLYVDSRLGESLLELEDDVVHLGPGAAGTVHAESAAFAAATLRVERTPAADVVRAVSGELRVNGAAAASAQLADGDRIECGGVVARYERAPARGASRAATTERPQPNPLASAITAIAIVGSLAALGWGAWRAQAITRETSDARSFAARAKAALADETPKDAAAHVPVKPPAESEGAMERSARDAYETAARTARVRRSEARQRYYEVWQRYPDTAYGMLARLDALDAERAARAPGDNSLELLLAAGDTPDGIVDDDTLSKLRGLAEDKPGTLAAERAKLALVRIQSMRRGRFDADMDAVRAAIGKRDWKSALEVIREMTEYVPPELKDELFAEKDRVLAGMNETQRDGAPGPGGGVPRKDGGGPPAPPKDPAKDPPRSPPQDAANEQHRAAEDLFRTAKKLMDGNKEADAPQALEAFVTLLRDHKAEPVVKTYEPEIRRRITTLAAGPAGIVKLFRGKVERAEKGRWRIAYDFQDASQFQDFRDVQAFERPPRAAWKAEGGVVKCTRGSGALLLDAHFKANEVSLAVNVIPERPHDLGVMFMDTTEDRRFYLFTLQNTYFTLGRAENAPPFLENAIVLFGPNMWRDTPPGQIGFVRKCGSDSPSVRPNEPTPIRAGKSDSEVWLRFEGGRSIRGSAYGDKPYDFPGVRPGLFVLDANGSFDDVVVEGTPDPDWVRKRWEAILAAL